MSSVEMTAKEGTVCHAAWVTGLFEADRNLFAIVKTGQRTTVDKGGAIRFFDVTKGTWRMAYERDYQRR